MPEKTPVRVDYTDTTATGLAEYQTNEYIPVKHGGTGNSAVSNAEVLIGNATVSDPKYLTKKIAGTANQISVFTSEIKIILTARPTVGGSASDFFAGETIYQGTVANPTATGVVITGTYSSTDFTIQYKTGEFVQGGSLQAQNASIDSNSLRTATILTSSQLNPLAEQEEITFKLGTYSLLSNDFVVDCGEIS